MKSHILVISQYFYPEQFRINDICTEWVRMGHKVTVVTGIPNYPQGNFFEGYGYNEKRTENWNGVNIIRLPIKPRKQGSINLILNYLSFVVEGYKWVRTAEVDADIVFTYEVSPMTQALVGVKFARKHNVKHLLYVTDLWPENVEIITGIHSPILLWPINLMVDYVYRHTDNIFTSSKSFVDKIAARGIEKKKLMYWPQYAEDFYRRTEKTEIPDLPSDDIPNLTFAGNIGEAQGLDVLVHAAELLKTHGTRVRFNIIGDGRYKQSLVNNVNSAGVSNYFNFIGRKLPTDIPAYLSSSDGALITLSKSEVFAMTIPAKTQSCLACGVPVIVSADGEVQSLVDSAQCGFSSDAEDPVGLAENITKFIYLPKEDKNIFSLNAVNYYNEHFSKTMLLDTMEAFVNE